MQRHRILIADDERELAEAYGRVLQQAGYEVGYVENGAGCLERVRQERPDLVLLEVVLPDISGLDVCRQIKAEPAIAGTFVVHVSGMKTSPEKMAEGLEAGADGYLTKPLHARSLLAHVHALMRIKTTERSLRESEEGHRLLVLELKEANRRLQEYNRLKAEFVANISHELRTPLTSIIGFANLANMSAKSQPLPPVAADAFERILRNGRHLLALIDDVLDISKIEAGRMPVHCEYFEVPEVVQDAFQELQDIARGKGLDYRFRVTGEFPVAYTDPRRVRQIALNLLSNALKFTSAGSVQVMLQVVDEAFFELAVRDTGIGIEEASQALIFDRFRQVDGSMTRAVGGVGLGLSIVRQLAQLLGGDVSVSSAPAEGSTFTLRLPFVAPDGRGMLETDPGMPTAQVAAPGVSALAADAPLVVVIEDDADSAELLSRTLEAAGYRPRVVPDGVTGLRVAREQEPAAVLLDIMMPGMDGWRVMRELKSDPRTSTVPVIVCSIVDNRPLGYRLGASDYLVKPVEPRQLIDTLRNLSVDRAATEAGYVLVVDDEHGIRELLVAALRHAGFEVRAAASGEAALRMAMGAVPQAVLCDLVMPGGMSGFELIARMRTAPPLAHTPIVVITGKDLAPEDRRLMAGQIANVIRKGDLLMSDLESRLRETLMELGVDPLHGENTAG